MIIGTRGASVNRETGRNSMSSPARPCPWNRPPPPNAGCHTPSRARLCMIASRLRQNLRQSVDAPAAENYWSSMQKPDARLELDRKSEAIIQAAEEDYRLGRQDAPSGKFWSNGKAITRHDAAVLDLARIELERRRMDEAENPAATKPTVRSETGEQARRSVQAPAAKAVSDSSAPGKKRES